MKGKCRWVPAAATTILYLDFLMFFWRFSVFDANSIFVHLLLGILFLRNPMGAIVLGGSILFDFAFLPSLGMAMSN